MIIIGEKLNSSISKTLAALRDQDEAAIIGLIKAQSAAGADYLDCNTAILGEQEEERMAWVISLILQNSKAGIMIDSQNPAVMKSALSRCEDRRVILNSVTLDDKFAEIISLAAQRGCGVVCMPVVEGDAAAEDIVDQACRLFERVTAAGVKPENVYIDAIAAAIASDDQAGKRLVEVISLLQTAAPGAHTVCGLSNISFGMPGRANLNAAMLAMAAVSGLDSVIADPVNEQMRQTLAAVKLLLGKDSYGMEYIRCMRGELLGEQPEEEDDDLDIDFTF